MLNAAGNPIWLTDAGAISDYVIRKYPNTPSVGLRVKVSPDHEH